MIQTLAEPASAARAPASRTDRSPPARAGTSGGNRHADSDPVAQRVLEAISAQSAVRRVQERRRERRYPYPYPVYLTPLGSDGPQVDETVQVMGKHLSAHGLDFYHDQPLPYRRMIASLKVNGRWVGVVLDLKWCRFNTDGFYENGGRLVSLATSPLACDEAACAASNR
ncbi:MAG: hypothetical protein KY475_06605 [Planctomycetes bacterium]|nr:hypothetical protein [Planctomycetota bacterium]